MCGKTTQHNFMQKLNTYIALLRGINVGGNNIIKMVDLRACFETIGFINVVTYIQSGNVVFQTTHEDQDIVMNTIEKALSEKFNYKSRVVVVSKQQLRAIVSNAPKNFGLEPTQYRYDVLFLKKPLTASKAVRSLSLKDGVDQVYEGKGVLYFSRLIEKASQSHLSKLITQPMYQNITIRNWNTTTKLLALVENLHQ